MEPGQGRQLKIVADSATELAEGVVNADGTVTYTYTLRDNLKWSDGKAVTAGDLYLHGIAPHPLSLLPTTAICLKT